MYDAQRSHGADSDLSSEPSARLIDFLTELSRSDKARLQIVAQWR
jgi:hypothetical protein